jgi:hypothetical protein
MSGAISGRHTSCVAGRTGPPYQTELLLVELGSFELLHGWDAPDCHLLTHCAWLRAES